MKEIINKWYEKLNFTPKYKDEFLKLLAEYKEDESISIETYCYEDYNEKENFLNYLYMCEEVEQRYAEKGIGTEILYSTLDDISFYANVWSDLKNELCLGECDWLKRHLSMRLFQLGRLQFCMGEAEYDVESKNLLKGDNILEIHIPEGGSFTKEDCLKSIETAKKFFAEFFPEFEYKCFTCDSWLLDTTLKKFLKPGSNILEFQNMFEITHTKESDDLLRYIFKWNSTRENIENEKCKSSFAQKVKDYALSGGTFYEAYGIIMK